MTSMSISFQPDPKWGLYDPDPGLAAEDLDKVQSRWETAFLSQRDVGLDIPINYLTTPGVSLRAACFGQNQYQDTTFRRCFSNLLAVGYRRFVVDVFWDAGRGVWSLCPVELSVVNGGDRADGEPQPMRDAPATTVSVGTRRNEGTATARPKRRGAEMWARQGAALSSSPSVTASSSTGTIPASLSTSLATSDIPAATATSSMAVASPGLLPSSSGETPVFQSGDYACSTTMTLELLAGLLDDYFQHTDITTTATMSYLIVNIHAAASQKTPNDPGAQPSPHMLPGEGKLISDVFKGNLSDKVYTPKKLQQERDTLNDTWLNVPWDNMPSRGYLSTSRRTDDTLMTEDGWPTETFVMFGEFHRLLAGFGTIDPQMAEYNVAGDRDIIFSSGELFNVHNTTTSSAGNVTNGCLPHSASTIPNANSSWAISFVPPRSLPQNPDLSLPIPIISNLTACGLSPFLNTTLSNTTADQDFKPYLALSHSTLWSWAPSEPSNSTVQSRCAVFTTAGSYPGRWYTADCRTRRRAACQNPDQPYNWTLSSDKSAFADAINKCPQNYSFAVPRTALENSALLSTILSSSPDVSAEEQVYINLNSLHTVDCWTTGGANESCPYRPRLDINQTRIVVVPAVASVIVFVLAAATFFVKCAANRRDARRGGARRVIRGWEYEGVPS